MTQKLIFKQKVFIFFVLNILIFVRVTEKRFLNKLWTKKNKYISFEQIQVNFHVKKGHILNPCFILLL